MRFLLFLQNQGWLEQLHYYLSQGTGDWMPRAHCVAENPIVMALHIIAELMIGAAYFSIPLILLYVVQKKAEFFRNYKSLILLFAAFIFLCGTTHFTGIVMFWYPVYWVDGAIKLLTGLVSIFTAITLFRLSPLIIQLPTQTELMDAHDRADEAEKRCQFLENKLEAWNTHVGSHIEALKEEHRRVTAELKKKGLKDDIK